MLLSLLVLASETRSRRAPEEVAPTTVLLVRRPEEPSLAPRYTGKPIDLTVVSEKARKAGYFEKRSEDTLYLFSPGVLPITLWQEEARAQRNIVARIAPDGTLRVDADSEEGRFLLNSLGTTEEYTGELTFRSTPTIRLTLQSGGRSADFVINSPLKVRRPDIAKAVPTERRKGERPLPRVYASAQAVRGDYVVENLGATMFSPKSTFSRRKIAFSVMEELASEHLQAEVEGNRTLYAALAPLSFDDKEIPGRGSSYGSLSKALQDDIAYAIQSNPKLYGLGEEGDAAKWLAGANVVGTEVWVGLEIKTDRAFLGAMLARRRY